MAELDDEVNDLFSGYNPDYFADEEFSLSHNRTYLGTNPELPLLSSLDGNSNVEENISASSDAGIPDLAKLKEIWVIKEESLTDEQKLAAIKLLDQNNHVFAENDFDLGEFEPWKHTIDTGDCPPLRCKPRHLSRAKLQSLKEELDLLQKAKIIRSCRSNWASPIVMVPKKDGTWRLCVDYRRLNAVATCCQYPLPKIDDILRNLEGACYFTALDLMKGFHQIAMDVNSIPKTAFVTPLGQYEYLKLPFGLHSAPAAFQAAMNHILSGLEAIAMVYIDDVIIHSANFEQHLLDLQTVLDRLDCFHMKIKREKCDFFRTQLLYLGHVINSTGIHTDPAKVSAVKDMPEPTCILEVETFLGKAGYYQKFMNNYSEIARPLLRLKRKDAEFKFAEIERKCFLELKKALCEAPVLRHPNFDVPFSLSTDASGYGLGAVLSQTYEGKEHPVAYASRTLKEQELRYSATEREALGIWWAIDHFVDYLEGSHFLVFTDHKALLSLGQKAMNNRRLELIAHKLSEFQFTIVYKKGTENTNADVLSRYPFIPCKSKRSKETQTNSSFNNEYDETTDLSVSAPKYKPAKRFDVQSINLVLTEPNRQVVTEKLDDLKRLQRGVPYFKALVHYLTTNHWPAKDTVQYDIIRNAELFFLDDSEILHRMAPDGHAMKCLPPTLYSVAFYDGHVCPAGGHFGIAKTVHKIQEMYWWPNMSKAIGEFIKSCPLCLSHKMPPRPPREGMGTRITPYRPWQRVHMDVWSPGGKASSGNNHVIAFIDAFSKYVVAVAIPNHKAETYITALLNHVILVYGMPEVLYSDGAPEFVGNLQTELCKIFGVTRKVTTPYRPQANGTIERLFRTIRPILSTLATRTTRKWDLYLPYVIYAYNTSYHMSILDTPFHVMFGRDSTLPYPEEQACASRSNIERLKYWKLTLQMTNKAIILEQSRALRFHDTEIRTQPIKEGDCVLLRVTKPPKDIVYKLHPKYVGPFRVIKMKNSVLYVLPIYGGNQPHTEIKRIHKDLARPCPGDYPPIHTLAELKQPFEHPDYQDPMNPPGSQLETETRDT